LFHSESLNTLIEQALRNNPNLPAAEAALRQAWENVYAEEGAFFPTAVVSYSPSRNKTATGITFTAASSGKPWFTLHTAQVVVTYAPDVFGGTRRAVESLMATAEFQRFQLEAAYLTLTSNVVAAAVQEASMRGQIAATQEIIKIQTDSLDILRKQFALGQVAGADVAAVEATRWCGTRLRGGCRNHIPGAHCAVVVFAAGPAAGFLPRRSYRGAIPGSRDAIDQQRVGSGPAIQRNILKPMLGAFERRKPREISLFGQGIN
jgi:hypothetical protein